MSSLAALTISTEITMLLSTATSAAPAIRIDGGYR